MMNPGPRNRYFAFNLTSNKRGRGKYYCRAWDRPDAWLQFEVAVAPMKVFRNHSIEHFTGDLLVPEGYNEPNFDMGGPRHTWIIDMREIAFDLLSWD